MGNVLSFMVAALAADAVILRIEDLDPQRSKQCYVDQLFFDLDYLGLEWEGPVLRQSERTEAYQAAFAELERGGLVYPCFCTRADLHSANAPHFGEEFVYPNTCRGLKGDLLREKLDQSALPGSRKPSWRVATNDVPTVFDDLFQGHQTWDLATSSGDFVVRRSDGVYAYQLAVVVDDAASGVNQVVRGVDLLSSVPRQRYLQQLLGLQSPQVGHVPLLVDDEGRRLSKRNQDASLSWLIGECGLSGREILGHLSFLCGMIPEYEPMGIDELRKYANLDALRMKRQVVWKNPSAC